jgi:uncharacterized RDD family membrane protein YckC
VANEQTPPRGRPGEAPPQQGYQQAPPGQQPATTQPAGAAGQQLAGPLPRAGFGERLGAFLIDSVLVGLGGFIVFLIFGAIGGAIAAAGSNAAVAIGGIIGAVGIILWAVIPLLYFGYMEGGPTGQTVGKRALNIRVVDFDTAGQLGVGRGMLRTLARILSGLIFYLGYLWMLWDPQQQTWHDKLVRTTVVPTSAYPVQPLGGPG